MDTNGTEAHSDVRLAKMPRKYTLDTVWFGLSKGEGKEMLYQ